MPDASVPPSPKPIARRYLSAYRKDDIGVPHIRNHVSASLGTMFLLFS